MTPLLAARPRPDRAFERLYKRHVGDVYRYALAVMRNPADAEDVTQTTFLNAYRAYVEKGSRPEKPQNWLIAIAHNVCRQRFRQSSQAPGRGVLRRRHRRHDRRRRHADGRRHPARARSSRLQPAGGTRDARARGALVRRDRRGPRGLDERSRDAHLPCAPCVARAARRIASPAAKRSSRSRVSSTDVCRGRSAASCARTYASARSAPVSPGGSEPSEARSRRLPSFRSPALSCRSSAGAAVPPWEPASRSRRRQRSRPASPSAVLRTRAFVTHPGMRGRAPPSRRSRSRSQRRPRQVSHRTRGGARSSAFAVEAEQRRSRQGSGSACEERAEAQDARQGRPESSSPRRRGGRCPSREDRASYAPGPSGAPPRSSEGEAQPQVEGASAGGADRPQAAAESGRRQRHRQGQRQVARRSPARLDTLPHT